MLIVVKENIKRIFAWGFEEFLNADPPERIEILSDPNFDCLATNTTAGRLICSDPSLALAKSAQHRLVTLLNLQLRAAGIFVGEVMVHGLVKGSAADRGQGTLESSLIAQRFWELYQARDAVCINVP